MNDFVPLNDEGYTKSVELGDSASMKIIPEMMEIQLAINNALEIKESMLQDIKVRLDKKDPNAKNEIIESIKYILWRYDLSPRDLIE